MPSRFGWIDIDEASRRTMLDFIDKFRDQGTLDELGIGTIRDAFADYFFPGTTTVQTRARYFLFVPWIYRRLEDKRVSSAEMSRRLKGAEFALLEAMRQAGVGEGERLIGRQSGFNLQRWPSNIYWAGLGTWGIRKFPGSQEAYHRSLDAFHRRSRNLAEDQEADLGDASRVNWDSDPHFPNAPDGFPEGATMQLRKDDAEYLRFKIRTTCANSLLSELLADSSAVDAKAIWALPNLADLPQALQVQIGHGRWFAYAIHGANLLYYWSVANADKQTALTEPAEPALAKWASALGSEWSAFLEWAAARKAFWDSPALLESGVPDRTRRFVDDWIDDLVKHGAPTEYWRRESALQLVKDREFETKGSVRARLWNAEPRRRWDPSGIPTMLDYRWGIASWILDDIQQGLRAESAQDSEKR